MLVVRRRDDDGVDIGPRQEVLVVLVYIDLHLLLALSGIIVLHPADEPVALDVIDIATGDHPDIVHRHETIEQVHGLLAEADETHPDLLVLGDILLRGGGHAHPGNGRKGGRGGPQRGIAEEISSLHGGYFL